MGIVLIQETVVPTPPIFSDVRTIVRQVVLDDKQFCAWMEGGNPWSKELQLRVLEFNAPAAIQDLEIRIQDGGIVPEDNWRSYCQRYTARFFLWVMYTAGASTIPDAVLGELMRVLGGVDLARGTGVSGDVIALRNVVFLGNVEATPQLNGFGVAGLWRANVSVV